MKNLFVIFFLVLTCSLTITAAPDPYPLVKSLSFKKEAISKSQVDYIIIEYYQINDKNWDKISSFIKKKALKGYSRFYSTYTYYAFFVKNKSDYYFDEDLFKKELAFEEQEKRRGCPDILYGISRKQKEVIIASCQYEALNMRSGVETKGEFTLYENDSMANFESNVIKFEEIK